MKSGNDLFGIIHEQEKRPVTLSLGPGLFFRCNDLDQFLLFYVGTASKCLIELNGA